MLLLLDPDLEKIAVQSRQRLVQEFAEKHATLGERSRRVPVYSAEEIASKYGCPLQIATVAYLIDMDGITTTKRAVDLLTSELFRRESIGEGVPNLPGNVQEFAVQEGRWISYIYGSFAREFEIKVRELANLESVFDEDEPPVEKAISLLNSRIKLAEAFLLPVVQAWLKDHSKGTSEDLLLFIGPAITNWNENTLRGKIRKLKRRNQALLRRLVSIITSAADSMTMDAYSKRIEVLITELDSEINRLTHRAAAHLIVQIAPRPTGARGDRSRYVEFGTGSTRGNKAEPDMVSPFDFLERDIRLAKRRTGDERITYLKERISRVLKVLKYLGNDPFSSLQQSIQEITERFEITNLDTTILVEEMKDAYVNAPQENYDTITNDLVYSFIEMHVFSV
ncbi:MAG: hypothetical protein ACFFED_02890 [Candidatus Thorarchaeota archaeon]